MKAAQDLIASAVGRKHYLDLGSEIFDASASAQAVRAWLDETEDRLWEAGWASDDG